MVIPVRRTLDGYQPENSDLTAIAAANPNAGEAIYWSNAATVSKYSISASGRALSDVNGAANAVPYFTSSTAVSTFLTTAAGRALCNVAAAIDTTPWQSGSGVWSNQALTPSGRNLWNIPGTSGNIAYLSALNTWTLTTITNFARTSLLNQPSATTARAALGFDDGTYVPTITGVVNVASTSAPSAQFLRVGDTVTVSGGFTLTPTAAGSVTFRISLPVASNFAANADCGGSAGVGVNGGSIVAHIANDVAQAMYTAAAGAQSVSFQFTYRVL